MSLPQILAIDLKIPEQAFKNDIQTIASNNSPPMKVSMKEMVMMKSGKEMLRISVDNDADSANFTFVAEKDTAKGELIFTPFKLRSMNSTFFSSRYDDDSVIGTTEDPGSFCLHFLEAKCTIQQGTLACITANNEQIIIRDGNKKNINGIALVDTDNNVYTTTNAKSIPDDVNDEGISFKIQKPINTWLRENPDVQQGIAPLKDVGDKMDYIGQYLIQARLNDEIAQDEFMDIFRQAGIFGFKNPSVQRIYKLLS